MDTLRDITPFAVLFEIFLNFLQYIGLRLVTTTERASDIILVALPSHTIETIWHHNNALGRLLVVTDKCPSEDHLHGIRNLGIVLDQVDS